MKRAAGPAVALFLLLAALGRAEPEVSRLRVGGDHDYPPYSFLDEQGRPAGFSVDLFRAVAAAMGLEGEIALSPWAEVRPRIEQGQLDVVIGMYRSPEREQDRKSVV